MARIIAALSAAVEHPRAECQRNAHGFAIDARSRTASQEFPDIASKGTHRSLRGQCATKMFLVRHSMAGRSHRITDECWPITDGRR